MSRRPCQLNLAPLFKFCATTTVDWKDAENFTYLAFQRTSPLEDMVTSMPFTREFWTSVWGQKVKQNTERTNAARSARLGSASQSSDPSELKWSTAGARRVYRALCHDKPTRPLTHARPCREQSEKRLGCRVVGTAFDLNGSAQTAGLDAFCFLLCLPCFFLLFSFSPLFPFVAPETQVTCLH